MKKYFCLMLCLLLLLAGCAKPEPAPLPTEAAPEAQTATEAPTQATTEAPTTAATEAPSTAATEAPTSHPTEPSVEMPAEVPTEEIPAVIEIHTDHYSLTLPADWEGLYVSEIQRLDSGMYHLHLYETQSYQSIEGGKLCSILMLPAEEDYTQFPNYRLLGTVDTPVGSCNFVLLFPSDVQFPMEAMESYTALFDRIDQVLDTFQIHDAP